MLDSRMLLTSISSLLFVFVCCLFVCLFVVCLFVCLFVCLRILVIIICSIKKTKVNLTFFK